MHDVLFALRRAAALALLVLLPAGAFAQSPVTVRIGDLGYTDASSAPLYGQSAGIFRKHGIEPNIQTLTGGGAIIAAIAGGAIDVGFANVVSAVGAIQRGVPIVVLVPAAIYTNRHTDTLLMKAKGSPLRTGADLNGKTVAVTTLNGTLQLCAQAWIDKNGGDSKTTKFLELPYSEMATALKAGRIDAAMISEPGITQYRSEVEPIGDAFAAIGPQWNLAVFVASKAWVAANPDAARRFVAAMTETARWANAHHAETAKVLSPLSGLDLATLGAMTRSEFGDTLSKALLQPPIDAAVRYGTLKAPYDTEELVRAAAAVAGR